MKRIIVLGAACLSVFLTGCSHQKHAPADIGDIQQISLDSMPESVSVQYNSDGLIETIEGDFAGFSINSEDDAYRALASVSSLMQCSDFRNEMRITNVEESPANIVYDFRQYYNDLCVDGDVTSLFVNKETGEIRRLKNTYVPGISIDTTPKFSENDLRKLISDRYGSEIDGKPELAVLFVYAAVSDEPVLIWKANLKNGDISSVAVNAENGEVLNENGPQY